ncbi:MAG TPA: hypothetical protein VMR77_03735 [Patescibacteria group bacterium]|nr:hypothetical protein [Patescibacteria group bacterium]
MNQKTSNLQKRILTTIYSQGEYEDLVSVVELNPEKVSVEYQLEKQKLVDERGGVFVREDRDTEGLLTKNYKVKTYRLKRSKLACLLFDWQEFNLYLESLNEAHLGMKPEDYYAREVALTNSLKSLKAKGYVEFLDYYEMKLGLFGKKHAKIIWLTTEGINKAESILTIKLN